MSNTGFDENFYKELNAFNPNAQARELQKKFDVVAAHGVQYKSIFFVGCALGHEPMFWKSRGFDAAGCELSEYAVQHSQAPHLVKHYDGQHLDWLKDGSYDAIASYDVLTLVPGTQIDTLAGEMVRVADKMIVVRTTISDWENESKELHGVDGIPFRLKPFGFWDHLFTHSGKFWLKWVNIYVSQHDLRETTYIFERRK